MTEAQTTEAPAAPPASKGFFSKSDPILPPQGTAAVIGSPDLFIQERMQGRAVKVRQVWIDGTKRGYAIFEGNQLGYFELTEGMTREDAIAAVAAAYDKIAVLV